MRTITIFLVVIFMLAYILPMAIAASEAEPPSPTTLVGSSALPEEVEEAQRMAGLAAKLRQQGKLAEAEKLYKDALDRNAADMDALSGITYTYIDLGRYDEAAQYCRIWLQAQPQSEEARAAFVQAARLTGQIAWADTSKLRLPANLLMRDDKLSIHIIARYTDFTPADVNAIVHEGSSTPRKGELIWLNPGSVSIQEAIRNDRGEVLAFNTAAKALLPDGSWSLAGASPDKDTTGKPCLRIWFDSRGAKRIAELTRATIGRDLAIVIDGRIVSAPAVALQISSVAMISGNFTDEDVMRMLRALLPKKDIVIEIRLLEISLADALSDYLHDTLGIGLPAAGRPFMGNTVLSESQAKQLLEWLTSQASAKTVVAPTVTVHTGETAMLKGGDNAVGTASTLYAQISILPYILRTNRIWMDFEYSITGPSTAIGDPNSPPMTDSTSLKTIVTIAPGQQMLLSGPGGSFVLLKASVAEAPAATPAD